jgi:hypothetical protein
MRYQALFGGGVLAQVDAVHVQRLDDAGDLGLGRLALGFPELAEIARADDADQQAEHDQDDQELEQGEAAHATAALLRDGKVSHGRVPMLWIDTLSQI